jgi:3',5'-cyclic-AMP phosphodiesterase
MVLREVEVVIMTQRRKYTWYTDVHLLPFNRFKMLSSILEERPYGVFLTGDISHSGYTLIGDLEFLGKRIGRSLFFTLGNHDYFGSSIEKVNERVRQVCKKYRNLIWIDEAGVVSLNEETALIGKSGWYDARVGNPNYIKYTFDWFLINDFRRLPTMKERVEKFRAIAEDSAKTLSKQLEKALDTYKTVFLLTHYPPWVEGNRCHSWIGEQFWTPYNTNYALGQALEKVMEKHKKRHLCVLAGHTHSPVSIHIARNIECRVGRGSYYRVTNDEIIYI